MRRWEWAGIAAITVGAAVLRLAALSKVSPDPFYDAAVRSMSTSFHNFFFGAFEPGRERLDRQAPRRPVAAGRQREAARLLLDDAEAARGVRRDRLGAAAVRRGAAHVLARGRAGGGSRDGGAAGRGDHGAQRHDGRGDDGPARARAAAARARRRERPQGLAARGAAALGLAFNVKLLESLVALPGLVLFAYLGLRGSPRRRVGRIALAGVVYVAVALSWLTATLLVPAHDRPWAIGSTNGSAWNAAFVFNGTDRLGGKSVEPGNTIYVAGKHYPQATQSQRDRIPIVPPSPTRLLARIGPLSGERLGMEVLAGLLLGIPALFLGLSSPQTDEAPERDERRQGPPGSPRAEPPARCSRRRRADGTAAAGRDDERRAMRAMRRARRPARAVDALRDRPVQRHGAAAPALRRGLHARRRGDARHRRRVGGGRRAGALAPGGARRWRCSRSRLLRRAADVRHAGHVVDHAAGGARRRSRSRCSPAHARARRRGCAGCSRRRGCMALTLVAVLAVPLEADITRSTTTSPTPATSARCRAKSSAW